MGNAFAGRIYVVAATKGGQTEFWAAATPRKTAAAEVQQLLPTGWMAVPTGWRLTPEKVAQLNMPANSDAQTKINFLIIAQPSPGNTAPPSKNP